MVVRPSKCATRRNSREHEKVIFADTSKTGWADHLDQDATGRLWSPLEKHLHINILEMKVALLALQLLKMDCKSNQVLITSDNTLLVAYINKQAA